MIDSDYTSASKYGNISMSDIDLTNQQYPQFQPKSKKYKIDNLDSIETVLTRGTSLFQIGNKPNYSPTFGTSPVPNSSFPRSKYQFPLSGQQNVDELLARKQQQRSDLNQLSTDGRVRSTKTCYQKYFNEELNENEHRVWWSSESQDLETDFD